MIGGFQVIKRQVKLEDMLNSLIERGGYSRNRQPILDSINVTAAALSQYARGKTRPSFDRLVGLADFFGVSLDYLVYGEPATSPVDPAPTVRYVEQALMDVRTRTSRHSDLVARIGRLLGERINDVATDIINSRSAGVEGLIEHTEILRVERYCRQANIIATDLEPNIVLMEDNKPVPGQFFRVVVDNLMRGCTYRFLLAGDLTVHSPTVGHLREMISEEVGGDQLHEHCLFRTSATPVVGAAVLYELDTSAFATEEPALYAQFTEYLDNTWLAYLNNPKVDSKADNLMNPGRAERTRKAFWTLWNAATDRPARTIQSSTRDL
jgi:transcriptional regulator with XRE-family HTH domain